VEENNYKAIILAKKLNKSGKLGKLEEKEDEALGNLE
jgi:hypothetical protein